MARTVYGECRSPTHPIVYQFFACRGGNATSDCFKNSAFRNRFPSQDFAWLERTVLQPPPVLVPWLQGMYFYSSGNFFYLKKTGRLPARIYCGCRLQTARCNAGAAKWGPGRPLKDPSLSLGQGSSPSLLAVGLALAPVVYLETSQRRPALDPESNHL